MIKFETLTFECIG